jgi:hypothetical protein
MSTTQGCAAEDLREAGTEATCPSLRPTVALRIRGNAPSFVGWQTIFKTAAPPDRARINVHETHELKYWTKDLGVTEEQLKTAVTKAGVMAADVRRHLGR